MKLNYIFPIKKNNDAGYTLVEVLITLLVFAMVAGLSFSTLSFFNIISVKNDKNTDYDHLFESIHLFFQRQIDGTDMVYIDENNRVYLLDMDSPSDKKNPQYYYNYYQLNKSTKTLMRKKYFVNKNGKIQSIGSGNNYPFKADIQSFHLSPEKNEQGYTGNLILQVVFQEQEDKEYESVIAVPEGKKAYKEIETVK